jgi:hypothetical protein
MRDELDSNCSTYWKNEQCIENVGRVNLQGLYFTGSTVDWIHLAQDMDHWWDLVSTVINLRAA